MKAKVLFIVWAEYSRRAETLAAELGAQLCFQYEPRLKGFWLLPFRYIVQGWKTWCLLERERPQAILVQSPPVFAPIVIALWCMIRANYICKRPVAFAIDCHTSTFFGLWRWSLPLLRPASKRAVLTIYHNHGAEDILRRWRVKGLFLSDGMPQLSPPGGTVGSEGEARVAFICIFDKVEPVAEVFAAARLLPHVTFYVTGDPQRASASLLAQKPENVVLTGFLRGGAYTALLKNVQGLVILTTQPADLSCGAFEAVAMAKPAVVSVQSENKQWFTRGFIYVENTPAAIAAGVQKMLDEQKSLIPEVIAMRSELAARRQPMLQALITLLHIQGESAPTDSE